MVHCCLFFIVGIYIIIFFTPDKQFCKVVYDVEITNVYRFSVVYLMYCVFIHVILLVHCCLSLIVGIYSYYYFFYPWETNLQSLLFYGMLKHECISVLCTVISPLIVIAMCNSMCSKYFSAYLKQFSGSVSHEFLLVQCCFS